jgi:hypothetical protein
MHSIRTTKHGSRYRRAAVAAAVLFKTTRRPPDPQAREAGRRRGRLLTGGGPGALCATVRRLVFTCRVLKIMLKIGGRGERRSSRRSARVFDSRAHTTHRRLWHNHIQPAQPSQTEPDATPERGETIVLDHFIRLAFKKRASLRSQQSWARATPSASTSRPAHGSRSKGPL